MKASSQLPFQLQKVWAEESKMIVVTLTTLSPPPKLCDKVPMELFSIQILRMPFRNLEI